MHIDNVSVYGVNLDGFGLMYCKSTVVKDCTCMVAGDYGFYVDGGICANCATYLGKNGGIFAKVIDQCDGNEYY